MKTKIIRSEEWEAMKSLVWDEFKDITRNGMIVITHNEMTNVFMNLLVEYMRFKKEIPTSQIGGSKTG